ncbi:MAG: C10 family peptidase [Prevotella sp.]|nr:C10 family peptidase [Prevotella sp.]
MRIFLFIGVLCALFASCSKDESLYQKSCEIATSIIDAKEQFAIETAQNFILSLPMATRSGVKEIGDVYAWRTCDLYPQSRACDTAELPNSVAQLVSDIGSVIQTQYGANSSSTNEMYRYRALVKFGYQYSYSDYDYDACMNDFKLGRPVVIGGYEYHLDYLPGHCWVIDGGLVRGCYEVRKLLSGGEEVSRTNFQNLVHCNWGSHGKYNGYFLSDNLEQRIKC